MLSVIKDLMKKAFSYERRLDILEDALSQLKMETQKMGAKVDAAVTALTQKITDMETVEDQLLTLLGGLANEIRSAVDDPTALNALADRIDADKQKMSDAITANTGL